MEHFTGFIIYLIFIGGVFVFGLWAYRKGIPVRWYELLSVVVGSLLGSIAVGFAINIESMVLLTLLIPAFILIAFGWWRVVFRYKALANNHP